MKPWGAVHAVAIEQRDRGILELRSAINEEFGKRGALEKTKRGRGVELDVGRHDCRSRYKTQSASQQSLRRTRLRSNSRGKFDRPRRHSARHPIRPDPIPLLSVPPLLPVPPLSPTTRPRFARDQHTL